MIEFSIISCVRDFKKYQDLVKATFLLPDSEFITIDNTENKYSLCQAYNIGKAKATGKFLIYVHEDVALGEDVDKFVNGIRKIFEDPKVGLIGFAGSKRATGTSWVSGGMNYSKVKHCPGEHILRWSTPNFIEQVVLVDGLCLITTREIADKIPWDERHKYFHMYDLDMSLSVHTAGYKVVVFDYWMRHFCGGHAPNFGEAAAIYMEKWGKQFPIAC
jgi:hypothetical protein